MTGQEARPAADSLLLVGDVGGTKTDLALVSGREGPHRPLAQQRFASQDYAGLEDVVRAFLTALGLQVRAACFEVRSPAGRPS